MIENVVFSIQGLIADGQDWLFSWNALIAAGVILAGVAVCKRLI